MSMREKIHRRANEELPKSERPEEKMRNGKGGVSKKRRGYKELVKHGLSIQPGQRQGSESVPARS